MAQISVNLLSRFRRSTAINRVVTVASSPDSATATLRRFFPSCGVDEPEWFGKLVADVKPLRETANTVEFLLPSTQESEPFVKFVVSILPTACSRHNSKSNAHALGSVVEANKGKGDAVVLLAPASMEVAFAQACAAGRRFPQFNMKNMKQGAAAAASANVDIVVDTEGLAASVDAEGALISALRDTIPNIRLAQRLVDMPPNLLHVSAYVAEARVVAAELGVQITVIQGKELQEGGFGGLWGVGQASEHLPALVVLSYVPEGGAGEKSICMVGKGIVYDTGGLSIKTPTTSMAGMKCDMGGSAAVLGGFAAAVLSKKLKAPLHALLCIAENSVDERSIRPDDILTFLSGKTVEVNNTDAEGRLVLADGCFYASSTLNPRIIIDIATLTGAQLIATGKKHAALYCNDEALEQAAVEAGQYTADLVFPLPYCPEFYKGEFKSAVADMKNSVRDRGNAQASCTGQFIGNHIEEYLDQGGKWLHVDMAGPAMEGERATGYGVALLSKLVQDLN
ncbi:cytosol aminopeptidase family, catalytic domain-containing protein [Ochromonadaceae sp. CCMP2298]|nr:cytosol aminopeptidase family, catalytic domain-containing protein [Ochromonadaceae sp. CCMP2298]